MKLSAKSEGDCYTSERRHKVCKIGNRFSRALKLVITVLLITAGSTIKLSGQTVLIDPAGAGGFELGSTFAANGWTSVNAAYQNYWIVGTANKYAGTRSAFISNNGTSNTYSVNRPVAVHFYRDITVPAGEEEITLSFYINGQVEIFQGDVYDRLLVYTAPTSVTPVAGVPASNNTDITGATLIYSQTGNISPYALQEIVLPASLAGTTFRLIFTWQNDNNTGSNPPASVDNISLTSAIDYPNRYSVADGSWNSTATWSYTSGGPAGARIPGANDNVYIEGAHSVTLDRNTPSLTLLNIASGSTLSTTGAYNVTAVTLSVDGTYNNGSTGTVTTTTMSVNAGGLYQHNINDGSIPTATWAPTSTCEVKGVTNTLPAANTFAQSFGNLTWNSTGQNTDLSLAGSLSTVNGNLSIVSTGSGSLRLMNGGGTGTYTTRVAGNYTQTGGEFYIIGDFTSEGASALNVRGNFTLSAGTFDVCGSSQGGSTGDLYAGGNFTLASGSSFTETGFGTASVYFDGTASQMYTSGGTITGTISFTVNNGATLQMGTGASPSVLSGGTNCSFTIAAGGTLGVTSAAGITTAGTTAGNIQVTTRTYTAGANYIYNGTSAQLAGNGLTANRPANLTIDNNAGVTLSAATIISGLLTMADGTLNLASNNLNVGSLTGSSNIAGTSGSLVFNIGSDNASPAAYSGLISNGTATSIAVTKIGTGVLTLANAAYTYTGRTTITGGELRLNPVSTTASFVSMVYLNGGTLGTSGISANTTLNFSAPLNLNASSTISLSSSSHSLNFINSSGQTWNGTTLSVVNWGSTGGRIFFGTNASGLTAGQVAKITFSGYPTGATILSTGEVVPPQSSVTIASTTPAYPASGVNQGSVNNPVYLFSVTTTTTQAVISGLQIPTSGSYVAGDLYNFKAWYSSDNSFSSTTDVLLSTMISPSGPGTLAFPAWTNQTVPAATTGYVFVTADIACSGTPLATYNVNAISTTDLSVYGSVAGATSAGGTQTIAYVALTPVTVFSASAGDASSVLNWNNPASCYDEVMIVARESYAVAGTPTGDGSAYTASLTYGSGTAFGGGYVVYKGSAYPQTVTSLINGLTYHFALYTRKGSTWSSPTITSATMVTPQTGDYRSAVSTGAWSSLSSWQYYNGASWVTPTGGWGEPGVPNDNSGRIVILYGHEITVTANVTVDEVIVDAGARVSVSNRTMTINDGADAVDLTVNGTMYVTGNGGNIDTEGVLAFNAGSVYQHDRNQGNIPTATWDPESTCLVTGITANVPGQILQSFGNFVWNCASQTGTNINFAGNLRTINGDLTIIRTGTGRLSLGTTQTNGLTVLGEYAQVGGYFYVTGNASNAGNSRTMNVGGDFSITGGTFDLASAASTTATVTVNVPGDFTATGGTITQSGTSTACSITFNGGGTEQRFTSGAAVTRGVNFSIVSPAFVQMGTGAVNAVIPATSTGTFSIASGGILGVTSPGGITTSGATGNIQVAGTRTYNAGASYIYNGTLSQSTGNGLSQNNPLNVTITNTGDSGFNIVTLASSPTLTGNLTVTNGVFDLTTNTCSRNASGGSLTLANGTTLRIGGTNPFPANYLTNTLGATSTTEFYGTNQSVAAIATPGYGHLILTTAGTKTAAGAVYVQSDFTINTGAIFTGGTFTHYFSGNWTNNGTFTAGTSTALFRGTTQTIGGTSPTTFNNLTANSSVSLTLLNNSGAIGNLRVARGILDLGTYTCNRSTSGGSLTVLDNATLKIGGTNTMPSNYTTHTLGAASTVEYSGAAQTIYPEIANGYGNLTLSGTGPKTIAAGTSVTVLTALTTADLLTIESSGLASNGSLIVNGASSGTLTYNRQLRLEGADYAGDYHYISSPVASNTALNSSKITAVWNWDELTGVWGTTSMTGLASGMGYNLDQESSSDGLISFTGTPVTTGFSITATSPYLSSFDGMVYAGRPYASGRDESTNWGGGGWNLLGNPFTSAMDATAFVIANSASFDPNYMTVYVYDGSIGDAGTYYYDNTTLQAGQGFFVLAMNNGVNFTFTPGTTGMQLHDNSSTMLKSTKVTNTLPGFDLVVNYGDYENKARIIYDISMTEELDPGYDIGQLSAGAGVEVYTTLVKDNGLNFARQALPLPVGEDKIIAVGVDTKTGGEVTFSADFLTNESYNVILEDRTAGIFTDLTTDTYKVTLAAGTYGTGRFFLHTKAGTTTGTDPDPEMLDVRIWSYGKSINIQGVFNSKAKASVFNSQGSMIYDNFLTDNAFNTIDLPTASRGLYIVIVVDGDDVYKQKVMIL